MIWRDVYLKRILHKTEIIEVIRTVFNVEFSEILLTKNISEIEVRLDEKIRVLCEMSLVNAEYPMSLSIYLRDNTLVPKDDIGVVSKMCKVLETKALISDDNSIIPNAMIMIGERDYEQTFIEIDNYENIE